MMMNTSDIRDSIAFPPHSLHNDFRHCLRDTLSGDFLSNRLSSEKMRIFYNFVKLLFSIEFNF